MTWVEASARASQARWRVSSRPRPIAGAPDMQNASNNERPWQREVLVSVLAVSAFVIVAAEFLRGSHLYGAVLGFVIVGDTIDWRLRARSDPAAGFDPRVVMLVAPPRWPHHRDTSQASSA
jgi:hypothetical protein